MKKVGIICVYFLILFIFIFSCIFKISSVSTKPKTEYCVVIDAGHGGRDGGCIGVNGSVESELNLEYAKTLKRLLETKNIKVVLTRENENGLYSETAKNKKLDDMKARCNIIEKTKPDLVVSIHMNSYSLKSVSGVKVFYKIDSEPSEYIAKTIQKTIQFYCTKNTTQPSGGDYYILNCTNYTSILVECGYLSNSEEEKLLISEHYRNKLMHSVFCGILIAIGYNYY